MDLTAYWAKDPGPEENLVMDEPEQVPGNSGGRLGHDLDVEDDAREAALMRSILRTQEQHREGGIGPELDKSEDPRPEA